MGKYKIKYFREKCIGAASCVAAAPDSWELDSENKAVPKIKEFDDSTKEKNIEAAKSCPTKAIEIYDEAGKQIV
jgi:ferredoxin